jgi:predicted  nucleic acid-binding Zn-ribbon protein
MSDAMQKLLVVQDRDIRIQRLERDLEAVPRERKAVEDELAELGEAVESSRLAIRDAEVHRKNLEVEVESMRERIAKYQGQQMQIKSNEEYRALTSEIDTLRTRIRGVEDEELQLMEQIETLAAGLKVSEAKFREEEREIDERRERIQEKEDALEKRLRELRTEREELAADCDPRLLGQYARILAKRRDVALVAIENGNCGGCHLRLPPATVNMARRDEGLVVCEHCGRMLYARD